MAGIYDYAGQLDTQNPLQKAQQYRQAELALQTGQFHLQEAQDIKSEADAARAEAPGIFGNDPAALQRAAGADPKMTESIQGVAQSQHAALRQATHAITEKLQQGDKAGANAIYQQVLPSARQFMPNEALPDQLDDPTAQKIMALSQTIGGGIPVHSIMPNAQGSYTAFDKFGNSTDTNVQALPKSFLYAPPGVAPGLIDKRTGQMMPVGTQSNLPPGYVAPSAQPVGASVANAQNDFMDIASSASGATVNSLTRTPERNAAVGGVPNSQHLAGTAMDITPTAATKQQIIALAQQRGYQVIDEGTHLHIQLPNGGMPAGAGASPMPSGGPSPAMPPGGPLPAMQPPTQPSGPLPAGSARPIAQSALEKHIALAKSMGATPDEIKSMVLGNNGLHGGDGAMTADGYALIDAAMSHNYTLPLPAMGMGGAAVKQKMISDLAAQIKATGVDYDTAVGSMIRNKAETAGLMTLTRSNAVIFGRESSALNQADIAEGLSRNVDRTGIPALNRWILAGRNSIAGDTDVSKLDNATSTLAEEYAKVMGAGNAAATDRSAAVAHSMLYSAMTAGQYQQNIDLMRLEMRQRRAGLDGEAQNQLNGIVGKGGSAGSPPPGSIIWKRDANGKLVRSQ